MKDDEIREKLPLLRASAADILILRLSCEAVAANRQALDAEVAIVAGDSKGLWGACARVALPVLFTTVERIIATFATDHVIEWPAIQLLLESDDPIPRRARLPKYDKGLPGKNCEKLERDLLSAFSSARLSVDSTLVRHIVALKKLRNECVHVDLATTDDRAYIVGAGFSGSAPELGLEDLRKAVDVVSNVLKTFLPLWLTEPWSGVRVDVMSDLPIYVDQLAQRLQTYLESPTI